MGSSLEGKNLLQEEQILFFESWPPVEKGGKNENMKMAELTPVERGSKTENDKYFFFVKLYPLMLK